MVSVESWVKRNPEKARQHARAHLARLRADPARYAEFRARENAKRRGMRKETPAQKLRRRERVVKKRYGVTGAEYAALALAQNGACVICGVVPPDLPGRRRGLHLDHSHSTRKVRALLCMRCNMLVGVAETKPAVWAGIAKYLAQHSEVP